MAQILIIDEDPIIRLTLPAMVANLGHAATCAASLKEGLWEVQSRPYDLVLLDIQLPDGNGLDILPGLRQSFTAPEVIVMTGYADHNDAEQAIHQGAWDYLEKPSSIFGLKLPLLRALQFREEKLKLPSPQINFRFPSIIGHSPALQACLNLSAQAAASQANVLLSGETGTGKELFARAIHQHSNRAGKNFIVVDCAALPETLVESMLFGHRKGAFTGAVKDYEGLVRQADGGTLFLDEVGELSLSIQKAFLRVLEARSFVPLGGRKEVQSNFRLIAASNRNLKDMVTQGGFRQDLLFRLCTMTIQLPPLRTRLEDLGDLVKYFLTSLCGRYGLATKSLTPEFIMALGDYDWPGNVRELMNILEQTVLRAQPEPLLFPNHLPPHLRIHAARQAITKKPPVTGATLPSPPYQFPSFRASIRQAIADAEQRYLADLIAYTQGDVKLACKIAQLSKTRMYELLKKFQLPKDSVIATNTEQSLHLRTSHLPLGNGFSI